MKNTRKNVAVVMQLSFLILCGFGFYFKIIRLDDLLTVTIMSIVYSLTLFYENWNKPYVPLIETCTTLFTQAVIIVIICSTLKLLSIKSLPDKTLMLYAALTYIIAIVSEMTPHIRVLIQKNRR